MLHETHILEPKNVGLYTWKGGSLKKCTVYTLMKMLTFFNGPLVLWTIFHGWVKTAAVAGIYNK